MQTTLEPALAPCGVTLKVRPPDLRRERRHAIPRGMKLKIQTSPQNELMDAELRDISRSGVGLLTWGVIPPGATISFPFGSQRICAQVRYCSSVGTGFIVGALITEVVAENGGFSTTLNV
jgi:hypothetical protein